VTNLERNKAIVRSFVEAINAQDWGRLAEVVAPGFLRHCAAAGPQAVRSREDLVRYLSLENPLPGYRDTRVYFDQFASILAGHRRLEEAAALLPRNPRVLASTQNHFLVHLPQEEYRRRMEDPDLQRPGSRSSAGIRFRAGAAPPDAMARTPRRCWRRWKSRAIPFPSSTADGGRRSRTEGFHSDSHRRGFRSPDFPPRLSRISS
jgi:hypothetical protein